MNIEHELRDALRRKEAPRELAERVLDLARQSSEPAQAARINDTRAATRQGSSWLTPPRWLAAAAVLTLAVAGGARYYEFQQQAAETERVRQELRIALQITNDALARVQSEISRPAENGSR